MSNWVHGKINDLFESTTPGEWGSDAKPGCSVAVLRSTNIKDNGTIDFSEVAARSISHDRLVSRQICNGDILIEKSGGSVDRPAGRVAYFEGDFKGTCSNFIELVKVRKSFNSKFVFYLLYYNFYSGRVRKYQQQTTGIINFKLDEYKQEQITFPESRSEQSAIARILSTVDKAIEKTEQLIAKYERIKTGLMQDLLTKGIDEQGRIRSESTHRFKDSPLGRIPVEWEVKRIDQIAKVVSGATPRTSVTEFWDGDICWITPDDLSNLEGIYLTRSSRTITQEGFRSCALELIPANSIVISSRAPIGYVAIPTTDFVTNQGCKSLILFSGQHAEFHLYNIRFNMIGLLRKGSGTTFSEITKKNLESVEVRLPKSFEEQQTIAKRIVTIEDQIMLFKRVLENHVYLKKGLLQDLLSGRVRVPEEMIEQMQKETEMAPR
jgi:type I restriction enzyme S subunit